MLRPEGDPPAVLSEILHLWHFGEGCFLSLDVLGDETLKSPRVLRGDATRMGDHLRDWAVRGQGVSAAWRCWLQPAGEFGVAFMEGALCGKETQACFGFLILGCSSWAPFRRDMEAATGWAELGA